MFKNYVSGAFVDAQSVSLNVNPSDTNDVIGDFASGSKQDVDDAVVAAKTAFSGWSHTTPQLRHDILKKAGDEVMSRREELGRILAREEGKTLPEGIGEATRAAHVLQFFAGECLRTAGEILSSVRPDVGVEITREPLGVIGVISPWNFPIAIPAWKIAPALAWGNCIVFKPAELTPHSAWMLVDILNRAGLPDGVLNLVMGAGSIVGQALVEHPQIAAISFTGSTSTGHHIAAGCIAGPSMKKLQLEMGGKNPLVVLDDADLKTAAQCALNGAFFSTGQRCTASSRLIVTDGIHDAFVKELMRGMNELQIGHALEPETNIGPVIDESQLAQNQRYLKIGPEEGATLACGGALLERPTPGYYMQPALLTDVHNSMRVAREEIFGPIATVIRVKDYDEALSVANDTEFGLSAGICTGSLRHATHFRRHSDVGMVMVNLPTAGVDYHVPFGGRKGSSYGPREQGKHAAEFYTSVKTSYVLAET